MIYTVHVLSKSRSSRLIVLRHLDERLDSEISVYDMIELKNCRNVLIGVIYYIYVFIK